MLFANAAVKRVTITQLHKILAHENHNYIRRIVKNGMITGFDLDENSVSEFCQPCVEGKIKRRPFPRIATGKKATAYGDKIVSDLWDQRKSKPYLASA